MKKIFSALIILCMVLSMTAFADDSNGLLSIEADKETAKPGDIITYTVSISPTASNGSYAEYKELQSAVIVMGYPTDKISIESGTVNTIFNSYSLKHIFTDVPNSKMFRIQINADISLDSLQTITEKTTLCTITAKVKDGVANGDKIELTGKTLTTVLSKTGDTAAAETLKGATVIDKVTVATGPKFEIASDSVNTVTEGGIVKIPTSVTEGQDYTIKAIAPFGKTATIYINGDAKPGHEFTGTFTEDTTVKVEYIDLDAENSILTWVIPMDVVYKNDESGIAAFGKGTIGDKDFGIEFSGGDFEAAKKYSAKAKNITPMGDIFAVEVSDAGKGDYHARAYIGDDYGNEVDFTK